MAKPPSVPSDFHPDLTHDRLLFLTALILSARNAAAATHEKGMGETGWSLGCRALERVKHAIIVAAETTPWLTIINPSLHFRFAIGAVPVGIYAGGDPEQPHDRAMRRRLPEIHRVQLAFGEEITGPVEADEIVVRIAVELDDKFKVDMITLVACDHETSEPIDSWPLFPFPVAPAAVTPLRAAPKKLPPVKVRKKKTPAEESEKDETKASDPGTGSGENG